MTASTIRTLIVDDEPPARERLRLMLADVPDISVVGEAGTGDVAINKILALTPDLVMLDVQIPPPDGFEVLRRVAATYLPAVVFVTAFDQYAIRAFDVHAIDYLLKPYDRARLLQALHRARSQLVLQQRPWRSGPLAGLLGGTEAGYPPRFAVRSGGRVSFVATEDIDWIEAADNYVRLHARDGTHTMRVTMQEIERDLDPDRFMRIHRSTIVNVARIKEIQQWFSGDHIVIMSGGAKLTSSRSYRQRLHGIMGKGERR